MENNVKLIQESLWDYAVCFLMDWFCEWVKANTVLHNLHVFLKI